jgi:hypothetical protein
MNYTKSRKHLSFRYLYFALGLCGILIATLANSPAPTEAALKSPAAAYFGVLERADCTQISGVAYDENSPDLTISVDIYDNGVLIATVPANRFRRDLYDAGWLNPNHGFVFPTPSSMKDGKIHQVSVNFAGTGIPLSGSPKEIACSTSLFPTAVPQTTASGQGSTWEQGVELSSIMSGIITKVRFWRSAGEPMGGHTATIWSASGARLTSQPFNETSNPGWQYATVNFPIQAGVRYRVTYNVYYEVAKTFFVFNNGPITKGPLTAWGSYYGTPAGTFPTSHSTSNLFADVVFNSPR